MNKSLFANIPHLPNPTPLLVPTRIDTQELLDLNAGSIQDVEANSADLWRINRYLGGLRALSLHFYQRLLTQAGTLLLIDGVTGSADMLVRINNWAQHRQLDLKCYGLDFSARNLSVARLPTPQETRIKLIQADALQLPFPHEKVDYFISSLFLHHLSPEQVRTFLARTFETSRRGIIMSDLMRGWLPLLAFKLVQPVFSPNFLTRQDGITSIYRAYTPPELHQLAVEAGLSNARVYQHWPWRMTLVADK